MEYAIIDRGRGPEIAGSRITVYDVLAETQAGVSPEQLAGEWQLDVAQIHLALRYIEEHKEEVLRDYAAIQARHARGNPPEIEKKLDEISARCAPVWEAVRAGGHAKARELWRKLRQEGRQGVGGGTQQHNDGVDRHAQAVVQQGVVQEQTPSEVGVGSGLEVEVGDAGRRVAVAQGDVRCGADGGQINVEHDGGRVGGLPQRGEEVRRVVPHHVLKGGVERQRRVRSAPGPARRGLQVDVRPVLLKPLDKVPVAGERASELAPELLQHYLLSLAYAEGVFKKLYQLPGV